MPRPLARAKYRVLEKQPEQWVVQKRGLLYGWNQISYQIIDGISDVGLCFHTADEAQAWLDDLLNDLDQKP